MKKNNTLINVTLKFYRNELLYDIKNIAWVASDVIGNEDNLHYKHHLADIGEGGNLDEVTRIMKLAISQCKYFLSRYINDTVAEGGMLDNTLTTENEFIFEMNVPSTMKKHILEHIKELIHHYIVYRVLVNWLGVICNDKNMPSSVQEWLEEIKEASSQLTSCKLVSNHYKISQSPF